MHVQFSTKTPPPHFGRNKFCSPTSTLHPASILSRSEVRRIIAEMLG